MRERIVNKGFVVGAEVAVIESRTYGRQIRKRYIGRVRKDGKFYLANADLGTDPRMWTPDKFGGTSAWPSGEAGFNRPHIELWCQEHDMAVTLQFAKNKAISQVNRLREWLGKLDTNDGIHQMWVDKLITLAGQLDKREDSAANQG